VQQGTQCGLIDVALGIEVTERAVHDDGQSSRELVSRDKHDRKRKEKEDRWKSAPSKAPLDSQESCILC